MSQHALDGMAIYEIGVNKVERQFFAAALSKKGARVWRSGWPDFLVYLPDLGHVGVEVKSPTDRLRPNQAKMFAALEAAGLRVFIWEPTNAKHLVPWWKYAERREDAVRYAHYRSDANARAEARRAELIRQLNCATSAKEKRAIADQLAQAAGTCQPSRKKT